ncbi:hypothetical protein ABBQ32_005330 [Trebouxia sp. C0010 RCD-2024]
MDGKTSSSTASTSQWWGCSGPKGFTRKVARWSPSKAPSIFATPNSHPRFGQARAPLQATAVPASQSTSVVTPLPFDTPHVAHSNTHNAPERKHSVLPRATVQAGQTAASQAQNQSAISHEHQLPDGCILELLEMRPYGTDSTRSSAQPPLLFVHGASHGAWCWSENFLPWFAQRDYLCFALSLRGHGNSGDESESCPDKYAQSIEDIAHVIASLPQPPVLVAHSMGGFFAQRYLVELAGQRQLPAVAGVVMIASASLTACVPNMDWWRSQQSFMHAGKVIWWMMTSQVFTNAKGDKEMLFSPDLPDEHFNRYHHMLRSGRQTLPATFKELQAFLPKVDECAEACKQLPLPIAVMLAGSDTLIMPQQVQASADYFGVEPITLSDLAHDVMLDTRWESAAASLHAWLQSKVAAPRDLPSSNSNTTTEGSQRKIMSGRS